MWTRCVYWQINLKGRLKKFHFPEGDLVGLMTKLKLKYQKIFLNLSLSIEQLG